MLAVHGWHGHRLPAVSWLRLSAASGQQLWERQCIIRTNSQRLSRASSRGRAVSTGQLAPTFQAVAFLDVLRQVEGFARRQLL